MDPIILRDQGGGSQTTIERIENETKVKYAIVLLTPDDRGRRNRTKKLNPRARQNVIFELGYLFNKLGRKNVLCLIKREIEKPSDIEGVNYYSFNKSVTERKQMIQKEFGLSTPRRKLIAKKNKPISIIEFNYHPDQLKSNNWKVVPDNSIVFQSITDINYGNVLEMQSKDLRKCFMQRPATPIERNSKAVKFIVNADRSDNYRLYCLVKVCRGTSPETKEAWLKIMPGNGDAEPLMYANPPIEWIVYVHSQKLKTNWIQLCVDLPKQVQETYGRDGWVFSQLLALRLRGTMKIAKISMYK